MSANKSIQNMQFENNKYYSVETNGTKDGPFCSACWDKDGKAIRLHLTKSGKYDCPVCKTGAKDLVKTVSRKPRRKYFTLKDKRSVTIPGLALGGLVFGSLISGTLAEILSFGSLKVTQPAGVVFLACTLLSFFIGLVPVSLATFLKRKHRNEIYKLSFFSVWLPFGIILWLVAVLWAIFDKEQ